VFQLTGIRSLTALVMLASSATAVAAQRMDSVWTIPAGSYAGQTIRLNTDLATRRGSKFLRISRLKGDARYVAWSPSRLPAPVAFRKGRRISAADSMAFWDILREMESDMGMRLFEPALLSDDSDPDDIIVVDTKNMQHDDGMTFVTWSTPGGIYDARVFVRSIATLHSSRVVAHEMMHALGFGHTSAWSSIMSSEAASPSRLTAVDVAYAQFALQSRAGNDRADMWERLALAMSREEPETDSRDAYEACVFSFERINGLGRLARVAPATVDLRRSSSCSR
jgi:hypothetical protein